jgi:hypothetical protein
MQPYSAQQWKIKGISLSRRVDKQMKIRKESNITKLMTEIRIYVSIIIMNVNGLNFLIERQRSID